MKRKLEFNTLHTRLRQIRESLGMTQEEFADALNISKPSVARYEAGSRHPGSDLLTVLLNKYGINLNWLLTGEETATLNKENSAPLSSSFARDKEMQELLELMEIPEIRRTVLAELDKAKQIFKSLVEKRRRKKPAG